MATRSLIIDLFKSPNGTSYGVLIAVFIVVLTTGFASKLFICCYRLALWIDFMLNLMSPIRSMTCALWSVSLHWSVRWSISIIIYIKGKALSKLSSLKFGYLVLLKSNNNFRRLKKRKNRVCENTGWLFQFIFLEFYPGETISNSHFFFSCSPLPFVW